MLRILVTAAAVAVAAPAAFAQDAAEGEKLFARCKTCHSIANGDDVIVKGGNQGPNLYGVIGRAAGTADFDKYGDDLVKAGEAGLTWTEENIATYVADPRGFLQEELGDNGARSKMAFRLRKGGEDVAAYLATFSEGS